MSDRITVVAEKEEYFPEECFRRYSYVDEELKHDSSAEASGLGTGVRSVEELNYGCIMEDGSQKHFTIDEEGYLSLSSSDPGIKVALNGPLEYEGHVSDLDEVPSDVANNIDYYSSPENMDDLDWAVRVMEADLISGDKTDFFDSIKDEGQESWAPDSVRLVEPKDLDFQID